MGRRAAAISSERAVSPRRRSLRALLQRPTLEVARGLLGAKVTTRIGREETSLMIVEVEAYHGDIDQASHCYPGKTDRNEVMFRGPGHCYVYFIYGIHHCVNVVTEQAGTGAAVLLRAGEPLEGLPTMRKRRGLRVAERDLTNGPGKLCQALGIDRRLLGQHFLTSEYVRLEPYRHFADTEIAVSTRIGISKSVDLPWRFYLRDNPWVSKARVSSG